MTMTKKQKEEEIKRMRKHIEEIEKVIMTIGSEYVIGLLATEKNRLELLIKDFQMHVDQPSSRW